jgi:uncharacterized protein YecE (DUF72 family)
MNEDPPQLGFPAFETPPAPEPGRVRFGTSSFSWEDWVGPFYPPRTKPGDFLRYYATQFDTVRSMRRTTRFRPRAPSTAGPRRRRRISGWRRSSPAASSTAVKAAQPDPARVLQPDATYADRDEFLAVMSRLGERLGPLVLQFPFFSKAVFPEPGPFFDRLDRFLGELPRTSATRSRFATPPGSATTSARSAASTTPRWCSWIRNGCHTAIASSG